MELSYQEQRDDDSALFQSVPFGSEQHISGSKLECFLRGTNRLVTGLKPCQMETSKARVMLSLENRLSSEDMQFWLQTTYEKRLFYTFSVDTMTSRVNNGETESKSCPKTEEPASLGVELPIAEGI